MTPRTKPDNRITPFTLTIIFSLMMSIMSAVPAAKADSWWQARANFVALGIDVPLKESRWSFNANLRYLDLAFEPKAEDGTTATFRFEPIVVGLGLGFRF